MAEDYQLPPRPELPARDEPLANGDTAPDFILPAANPDMSPFDFRFSEFFGDAKGLLVFYQDDGMPICTSELKAIAQECGLLNDSGVKVAAINTNGLGSHQKFQERDHFPFPLVSDFHGDVVKAFGMWDADEQKSRRGVFVLRPGGEVLHVVPHFNPGNINAFEEIFEALGLA